MDFVVRSSHIERHGLCDAGHGSFSDSLPILKITQTTSPGQGQLRQSVARSFGEGSRDPIPRTERIAKENVRFDCPLNLVEGKAKFAPSTRWSLRQTFRPRRNTDPSAYQ